jgi:hypothetical protein
MEELQDFEVVELGSKNNDCKILCWPQGSRATKEDQKNAKLKKRVLCAEIKITADMATATTKKAKILENQATLQLFIMLEKLITTLKPMNICCCKGMRNLQGFSTGWARCILHTMQFEN